MRERMRIMVAGGAGFLGSNLCRKLLDDGHQVVCIDNLITGSRENISELETNPNYKHVEYDVTNPLPIEIGKVDQIYHLASPASPNINSKKSYHALAFETMKVNTTGTWNLAEYAVKYSARMLFSSTSEVYGEPLEHPQKESYRGNVSTTGPRSVYDEGKRFGETIVAAYVRSRNLDGRIIRIFNTYGPRMIPDDGRVVSEFMYAAAENRDLKIFGSGEQTRSFCFVDDLIEGIVAVMNHPNLSGEVINLGNPREFSILELAKMILVITGSKSKIILSNPMPIDDPSRRQPDISLASEKLGWTPKTTLADGLKKYWDYIQFEKTK